MSEHRSKKLREILRVRPDDNSILKNRENQRLEFKKAFNLAAFPVYVRTMAAFANNRGGYIVFGVKPKPHRIVGIDEEKFERVDSARLSTYFNEYMSPSPEWDMDTLEFAGKRLGYLCVDKALQRPLMITKSNSKELRDGDIFYRYSGQTRLIRHPELRTIIEERLELERAAWRQHFNSISSAGATNVAVLDTIHGKIFGGGAPFLIDEKLLHQLKFVREGKFTRTGGIPTLRLVGEVKTLSGVSTTQYLPGGIHVEDIVTAFLARRPMDKEAAVAFLRELPYQNSFLIPIFYFSYVGKLSKEQTEEILSSANTSLKHIRSKLVSRVRGTTAIKSKQAVEGVTVKVEDKTPADFAKMLKSSGTQARVRGLMLAAMRRKPELVADISEPRIIHRLLEAVCHLRFGDVGKHSEVLFDLLLAIYTNQYQKMGGPLRYSFQRAIVHLDQIYYGSLLSGE